MLDDEPFLFDDELFFDFESVRDELELFSSSSGALLGFLSSPQHTKNNDKRRTETIDFFINCSKQLLTT